MIDAKQKELITAAFGKQYSNSAIAFLTEQNMFYKEDQPFKVTIIKNIVNGITENEPVERELISGAIAILEDRKAAKKAIKQKSKSLLNL